MEADAPFSGLLLADPEYRMTTLQEVLRGKLNPLDRRIKLAEQRPNLLLGEPKTGRSASSDFESFETEDDHEESEQEDSGIKPAPNVVVEMDSPTDNEIQAANEVAEDHPEAEKITLSQRKIKVHESSGDVSVLKVDRVLRQKLGVTRSAETVPVSTPSMSKAAAAKHGERME